MAFNVLIHAKRLPAALRVPCSSLYCVAQPILFTAPTGNPDRNVTTIKMAVRFYGWLDRVLGLLSGSRQGLIGEG